MGPSPHSHQGQSSKRPLLINVFHSLRHGGATEYVLADASLEWILTLDRWNSSPKVKGYVQLGKVL